ncbi:hypothetical protein QAD02_023906 [Eretmocerus hayati]|uniref:Uncharacterized protein n=1 Tax=Eretmocerus hayati TaxID=131215 RepID=A0ACC2PYU8_9HYME|nr:hypothetical protein QAD02_023906 [Eretmocerus hayati]
MHFGQQLSPPKRAELQRAWEDAIQELTHTDVELAWVEQRPEAEGAKKLGQHPTALVEKFCEEAKVGRTALVVLVGGGAAMRFLITATTAARLPTLWMPYSNRDFVRQGRPSEFESRVGSGSEEMGAAAGALMTKAHWRAFTLLLDPTLLTLEHLVPKVKRRLGLHPDVLPGDLVPRRVVYLPQHDDKSLGLQLRRVADENGRGSVVVLACDLGCAKKIITIANKHEMLAGRFLWLWLDLKAELRPSEPNIIGSHILNNARASFVSDNIASQPDGWEFGPNFSTDTDFSVHTLSSMAAEVNKMQEYLWHSDAKDHSMRRKRSSLSKSSPTTTITSHQPLPTYTTPANIQHQARSVPISNLDEDEEGVRYGSYPPNLNSKSFMPLGMLALRAAPWRSPEPSLGKILRETARALERAMLDTRHQRARMSESQLRDAFTADCFVGSFKGASGGGFRLAGPTDSDPRSNLSRAFTSRMRESARTLSKDRSEFQLLNLQGVLFPGNKTLLRWAKVGTVKGGKEVRLDTIIWPGGGIVPAYVEGGREKIGMPSYKIVTALAPPFAMVTNLQEGTCLRGLTCKLGNAIKCCYGYSMDILDHASRVSLKFFPIKLYDFDEIFV